MVKMHENLVLFGPDLRQELSILESRKHNRAVVCSNSGGLQSRSTSKRIGLCRKASSSKRGLRKSSSLTNGMNRAETKSGLEIMALRPEVLSVFNLANASVLDTSAEAPSMVARRMS